MANDNEDAFAAIRKVFETSGKQGALAATDVALKKSAILAENTDRQRVAFMEATVSLVIQGKQAGMATQTMIEVFEGALENLKQWGTKG